LGPSSAFPLAAKEGIGSLAVSRTPQLTNVNMSKGVVSMAQQYKIVNRWIDTLILNVKGQMPKELANQLQQYQD